MENNKKDFTILEENDLNVDYINVKYPKLYLKKSLDSPLNNVFVYDFETVPTEGKLSDNETQYSLSVFAAGWCYVFHESFPVNRSNVKISYKEEKKSSPVV